MLRKYLPDSSDVIHHEEVLLGESLMYEEMLVSILDRQINKLHSNEVPTVKVFGITITHEEMLVSILDRKIKKLHSKEVPTIKVLWSNNFHEEATWEVEGDMHDKYPQLFESWVVLIKIRVTEFLKWEIVISLNFLYEWWCICICIYGEVCLRGPNWKNKKLVVNCENFKFCVCYDDF